LTRSPHSSRDLSKDPSRREGRPALGRLGEDAAASFLAARGYRIVARNVRADRVELDLIVRRGGVLVFVEVKSRSGAGHGQAAEAVDPRKQRRLRHGARAWLATRPTEAAGVGQHRFDVVTCILLEERLLEGRALDAGPQNTTSAPDGARWSIEHWESAF